MKEGMKGNSRGRMECRKAGMKENGRRRMECSKVGMKDDKEGGWDTVRIWESED